MSKIEELYEVIQQQILSESEEPFKELITIQQQWLKGEIAFSPEVTRAEIRQAWQLALLKEMKRLGTVQPNHQMTPDAIGLMMGYLIDKLKNKDEVLTVLDLGAGTGNLLYTVMELLPESTKGQAVEIDEILVRYAAAMGNILERDVQFHIQDVLRPLFIDPVSFVITDVPVGYYPDDDTAADYHLMPLEGHAYAHHLFIEQGMNYLKPGGYGLFIVPATLFESEQGEQLQKYLKEHSYLRAFLELPRTMVKQAAYQKGILLVQKPSPNIQQGEVLLAQIPIMSDAVAMQQFFQQFQQWLQSVRK